MQISCWRYEVAFSVSRVQWTQGQSRPHAHIENECRYAPKHVEETRQRRAQATTGQLPRLPTVVATDQGEHGAPRALDQEPLLYPDESEDVVIPNQTESLDQNPLYTDPEGPAPPPPPHPRHAVMAKTKKIMAEAGTQATSMEDAPSWLTYRYR